MKSKILLVVFSLIFICFLSISCNKEDFGASETPNLTTEIQESSKIEHLSDFDSFNEPNPTVTSKEVYERILNTKATARGGTRLNLSCGQIFRNRKNSQSDGNNHAGCSTSSRYYAPDEEFIFFVSGGLTKINIRLSGERSDLDLFLFNTNTNLQKTGYCIKSSTSGSSNENISVTLPQGAYIAVVDGYAGSQRNFNISLSCGECEDFDNFNSGSIINQSNDWSKYKGFLNGDGSITNSSYGGKILNIKPNGVNLSKIFNKLDQKNSGKYLVTFKIYVPEKNNAYFGLMKSNSYSGQEGVMVGLRQAGGIVFESRNEFKHYTANNFRYSQNKWMDVAITIDFDDEDGWARFQLDEYHLASWKTKITRNARNSGTNGFNGLYFWSKFGNSNFYIDDLCVQRIYNDEILIIFVEEDSPYKPLILN